VVPFPHLINQEFIYNTSSSIEGDKNLNFSDVGNKEILQTIIGRIKTFTQTNDDNYKKSFLENLTSYSQNIGFENTCDMIVPILSKILDDSCTMKINLMKIFPDFISYITTQKGGYNVLKNNLLNLISELLTDRSDEELKNLVYSNFIRIANCLNVDDLGNLILTKLLQLANDDSEETTKIENRILAARLFSDLGLKLGKEYCELYIVPQIASLADDPSFRVRKEVVTAFPNVCSVIGQAVYFNKMLPIYQK
jgi:serine/threonine-protein phosphatase 4 regulatory subunit 1